MMEVALRKESVDRNFLVLAIMCSTAVALRKESVDRNLAMVRGTMAPFTSLSARRAWIEIENCKAFP